MSPELGICVQSRVSNVIVPSVVFPAQAACVWNEKPAFNLGKSDFRHPTIARHAARHESFASRAIAQLAWTGLRNEPSDRQKIYGALK